MRSGIGDGFPHEAGFPAEALSEGGQPEAQCGNLIAPISHNYLLHNG